MDLILYIVHDYITSGHTKLLSIHELYIQYIYRCVCVNFKDRKRSLRGKKDHNALWHYRNSHNAKFRVVAVFKQPQRVVACEDMP